MPKLSEAFEVFFGESGIRVYCGSDEDEAVRQYEAHKSASKRHASSEFIPVRMKQGSVVLREYDPANDRWDD